MEKNEELCIHQQSIYIGCHKEHYNATAYTLIEIFVIVCHYNIAECG